MEKIFKYKDYKGFLTDYLESQGKRSGLKSQLAQAMGIHPSHLSLILKGQTQISLEQAERLSCFLKLSKEEAKAFLLLVLKDKAGSETLKEHFFEEFQKIVKEKEDLASRFEDKSTISLDVAEIYFSHWIYQTVHVLVSIEKFKSFENLKRYLQYPEEDLREVVEFLKEHEFITEDRGELSLGVQHIEQGKGYNEVRNHINIRSLAMKHVNSRKEGDIHYSAMVTANKEMAEKIRQTFLQTLEDCTREIIDSPAESVYVIGLDFFSLRP